MSQNRQIEGLVRRFNQYTTHSEYKTPMDSKFASRDSIFAGKPDERPSSERRFRVAAQRVRNRAASMARKTGYSCRSLGPNFWYGESWTFDECVARLQTPTRENSGFTNLTAYSGSLCTGGCTAGRYSTPGRPVVSFKPWGAEYPSFEYYYKYEIPMPSPPSLLSTWTGTSAEFDAMFLDL